MPQDTTPATEQPILKSWAEKRHMSEQTVDHSGCMQGFDDASKNIKQTYER